MTIYSLDLLLCLFGTSLFFHVQFWLLLPDLHTNFSRGRFYITSIYTSNHWNMHVLLFHKGLTVFIKKRKWKLKSLDCIAKEGRERKWKLLCPVHVFVTPRTIVNGILQARIVEWVAVPFSRGSSQPRDQTQVSRIAGGFLTIWAAREAQEYWSG